MGYPTKRVSMTDVHGEPQQGGYLPAEIWHAYMAAVTEGKSCPEFPPPKESISYQPFFGRFASTGRSSENEQSNGEPSEKGHTKKPSKHNPTHTKANESPETTIPRAREPHEPHEPAISPPVEKHAPEPAPTGGAEPHP
jgi:membrane carboxypeptidase/penicillin-binding protein